MKKLSQLMALALLVGASQAHAAVQFVGMTVAAVLVLPTATVGGIFWGPSYSASKASGTFPTAVRAGDATTQQVEKVIYGVKMDLNMLVGARAEAQTFLASEDSYEQIADKYPMLAAAVDEANRQAGLEGYAIDPYSLAENIANFAE